MRQLRHNAAAAAFHLVGLQLEHLFPIGIRSSVSDNHILKCLHKIVDCFLAGKPGGAEAKTGMPGIRPALEGGQIFFIYFFCQRLDDRRSV